MPGRGRRAPPPPSPRPATAPALRSASTGARPDRRSLRRRALATRLREAGSLAGAFGRSTGATVSCGRTGTVRSKVQAPQPNAASPIAANNDAALKRAPRLMREGTEPVLDRSAAMRAAKAPSQRDGAIATLGAASLAAAGAGTAGAVAGCRGDRSGGTRSPSSARRTDRTLCGRSHGAIASIQSIVASIFGPTPGNAEGGDADSVGRMSRAARTTEGVGARPVTTKYNVAPSEYKSVQGPCRIPASSAYCSSGANCGLSWAVNDCEPSTTTRRAQPKSSSTGRPSPRIMMLSGEMSRWNTPSPWSNSSAPRIDSMNETSPAHCGAAPARKRHSFSVWPGQYCIAM